MAIPLAAFDPLLVKLAWFDPRIAGSRALFDRDLGDSEVAGPGALATSSIAFLLALDPASLSTAVRLAGAVELGLGLPSAGLTREVRVSASGPMPLGFLALQEARLARLIQLGAAVAIAPELARAALWRALELGGAVDLRADLARAGLDREIALGARALTLGTLDLELAYFAAISALAEAHGIALVMLAAGPVAIVLPGGSTIQVGGREPIAIVARRTLP